MTVAGSKESGVRGRYTPRHGMPSGHGSTWLLSEPVQAEQTTLQVFTVVVSSTGGTTAKKVGRIINQYTPNAVSVVVDLKGESEHSLPRKF